MAEVEGLRLAVIHNSARIGATGYYDPMTGVKTSGKRYQDFLTALHAHDRVVIQRDIPGTSFRDGYVGIFKFKDLAVAPDGAVSLTLTMRDADPS
jgi:hypothetical protein